MELKLREVMERPFVFGIKAIVECKDLDKMVAHRAGWVFKKLQNEAKEWQEYVDAQRAALEATFTPDTADTAKQVALMQLNKKLDREVEAKVIVVKCAKIDYKYLKQVEVLTGEQLVALEPICENVPKFEESDEAKTPS